MLEPLEGLGPAEIGIPGSEPGVLNPGCMMLEPLEGLGPPEIGIPAPYVLPATVELAELGVRVQLLETFGCIPA